MSIYERLGEENLKQVIRRFYERAFTDPIISHFFFSHDLDSLVEKQIDFARAFLGGPKCYRGKGMRAAHRGLKIRRAHFDRRQMLMKEVLMELKIDKTISDEWLRAEHRFVDQIVEKT